jgi:Tfp pilus assembly protein PilN
MFTIDLLKGQGLPVRTRPKGVAIFVATFTVPALVAILMASYYVRNEVVISIQKQNIVGIEMQTQRLADALKLKESYEKDKSAVSGCLVDVAASVRKYIQWSPVLVTLVENLPDSVVLTGLEVSQHSVKRKVAAKGDAEKKVDSNIPVRTLKMRVSGNPTSNCDIEVRAFRDRLRASKVLEPVLEEINFASLGHDKLDGRDVVCYDIECVFKSGL